MDDASALGVDFDPNALRDKYRQERDKRIRKHGDSQYVEMAGAYARYNDEDPYVAPGFELAEARVLLAGLDLALGELRAQLVLAGDEARDLFVDAAGGGHHVSLRPLRRGSRAEGRESQRPRRRTSP